MDDIINNGWKVDPATIIIAYARATTYIPSMENIEMTFRIPKLSLKYTFEEINVIIIQYAMSIILHKRMIENNEPPPLDTQPP